MLLYGKKTFFTEKKIHKNAKNMSIIKASINYIKNSKRFEKSLF